MIDLSEFRAILPEAAAAILEDSDIAAEHAAAQILGESLQAGNGILRNGLRTTALLFAALFLCSVCRSLVGKDRLSGITAVGALSVAVICFSELNSIWALTEETLTGMDVLSKALLPVLTAAGCAAGAPSASIARYTAVALFSTALFTLINSLLLPVTMAAAALYLADGAVPDYGLGRTASFLSALVKWILTTVLTAFVTYLTFTGILSGSSDAALVKGTKLGISTAIPVVGSVLADAADTVMSAAKVLRGTIGAAGFLGILSLCLGAFLRIGIGVLLYRLTAALCAPFAERAHSRLLEGLSGIYGLLLAQVGSGAMLLFLSIASAAFHPGGS